MICGGWLNSWQGLFTMKPIRRSSSSEVFVSISHEEVLKLAPSLPEADRILLATKLLDSFDDSKVSFLC